MKGKVPCGENPSLPRIPRNANAVLVLRHSGLLSETGLHPRTAFKPRHPDMVARVTGLFFSGGPHGRP